MSIDDRRRHRELRVQRSSVREHVLGVVAGRARVPQSESGDAVGVDVLGGALELGEDREFVSRVFRVRMRDLEQHGAVALHDEGAVRHNGRVYRAPSTARVTADPSYRGTDSRRHAGRTATMLDTGSVRSMSAPGRVRAGGRRRARSPRA